MGNVGEMSAQMVLDDKGFSATAQKMDGLIALLRTDLKDLGESVRSVSDSLAKSTGRTKAHTETMSEGEKALRGFYKEQKLGDRVMKDSQNAIVGLTMGLVAMLSGMEGGNSATRKFVASLGGGIAAMQGAEFAATGLGVAGKNLPGVFGRAAEALGKYSGVIGAVIGAGVGLYMFFKDTKDWAKIAVDDGLKKFSNELDSIAGKIVELLPAADAARREVYRINAQIQTDQLNQLLKVREAMLNGSKSIEETFGELSGMSYIGTLMSKLMKQFSSDDEKIKAVNDEIATLMTSINESNALANASLSTATRGAITPGELKKDKPEKDKQDTEKSGIVEGLAGLVEYGKKRYEIGEITKDQYLEQLTMARAIAKESSVGYDIQKTINDLLKDDEKTNEHLIDQITAKYKLGKISAEKAIEELQAIRDVTEDVNDRLKIEQRIVDVQNDQISKMSQQLDQASRIGNLLVQAFSKGGDDFISKLNQALQIVVRIAKMLKEADKPGADPLGLGDYFEMGMTFLGFLAKTGGAPSPEAPQPAAPAVPSLSLSRVAVAEDVRSTISKTRITRPMVSGSSDTMALMQEIRAMRSEIADIRSNPPIININNPISLGRGLEVEMPNYEKYKKEKFV